MREALPAQSFATENCQFTSNFLDNYQKLLTLRQIAFVETRVLGPLRTFVALEPLHLQIQQTGGVDAGESCEVALASRLRNPVQRWVA
jgi:hypothetical protein